MTSRCVPTPPALLLPLISHPDLPSPALHRHCARMASPRCSLLPLPLGVLAITGGCARDIRDPTPGPSSTTTSTSSASLVLLFVSRCFYSSMSISSIVFLSIYTFILFSRDHDATSKSLSGSYVALIRATSLPEFILLLHKPPP